MAEEIITLKCGACGKEFNAYKPTDNVHNVVECPACKQKITLKLNPVKITRAKAGASNKPQLAQIGIPQKAQGDNRIYIIKERALTGKMYLFKCPECGFSLINKVVTPGNNKWRCPKCQTLTGFVAISQSPQDRQQDEAKAKEEQEKRIPTHKIKDGRLAGIGELVYGGFLSSKHFPLREGTVTIGRRDADVPSDLQLDDEYISRRSVTIDTLRGDNGYSFKFTVKKATNPVYVNSTEIMVGNSLYLNYGDTITIGCTKLTFKKTK